MCGGAGPGGLGDKKCGVPPNNKNEPGNVMATHYTSNGCCVSEVVLMPTTAPSSGGSAAAYPTHAPAPTLSIVAAAPPGAHVEQPFRGSAALPTDWSAISDASLLAILPDANESGRTFSRADWVCRPGVFLARSELAGSETAYYFVDGTVAGTYTLVAPQPYTEATLPPPPVYALSGGVFDGVTAAGRLGWGVALVEAPHASQESSVVAVRAAAFREPAVCFVLTAGAHERPPKAVRVVATVAAANLDVEVEAIDGTTDTPVTGKVGKRLDVSGLPLPIVVRVKDVPASAAVAFQGVEVEQS